MHHNSEVSGFWMIVLFYGLVQMYTGTGADGMTERNFKVHLQLWDTAGQERYLRPVCLHSISHPTDLKP